MLVQPSHAPFGRDAELRLNWPVRPDARNHARGTAERKATAAITGRSTSPGIFDVLAALGREESLGRIADKATSEG